MRGSVWHIFNCPNGLPRLVSFLRWQCRNIFHTCNQHSGSCPANSRALLMVRPNSNKDQVDNLCVSLVSYQDENNRSRFLSLDRQSSRIRCKVPLFSPVNCSVVKFRGYGHAHRIQCITTAYQYEKFHYWHISWKRLFAISICFSSSR